ncbi:hypothetical protein FE257_008790 [Aspergillus nanangensis]|uniref:NYN domain-containing protein n=1 Tax=Aspergillus nanangensis TaxID=2582783 RepID=A0AAD4GT55_ASPNN|nr:hypothetical protein FE257_008790 [Aspergillus nanangensis]
MQSSTSASTNWDFTPVIDLLRSPSFGGGNQSIPSRYTDSSLESPSAIRTTKNATKNSQGSLHQPNAILKREQPDKCGSPKLGDFGSLWDFLGNTTPTQAQTERPHTPKTAVEQPSTSPKRITILKRTPYSEKSSDNIDPPLSRATPKPIPGSGPSNARKATVKPPKVISRGILEKTAPEAVSSDNTIEAESDSNLSIFDPSLTKKRGTFTFIPPQVGATSALGGDQTDTPPSSYDELGERFRPQIQISTLPSSQPLRVQPTVYKSAADRRVGLLTKLLKQFPDYAELVTQIGRPLSSKKGSPASRPIHVFVDMSNIMVGFHDCVKTARNIPVKTRIRRLPFSFQNFSLILERGRPSTKRVLVGSDRFAAIHEGEQLGYETNILDRVQKVKLPPRRQMKSQKHRRAGSQDAGSGSETNDVFGERWVEQGVDEILHLKILESLLDTEEPATIVLATGDAAEAEFSGGFMKMVERALQRGWRVELVSFSLVTSYAYQKKDFRAKWGNRFKVIMLDDYIEELLDL